MKGAALGARPEGCRSTVTGRGEQVARQPASIVGDVVMSWVWGGGIFTLTLSLSHRGRGDLGVDSYYSLAPGRVLRQ